MSGRGSGKEQGKGKKDRTLLTTGEKHLCTRNKRVQPPLKNRQQQKKGLFHYGLNNVIWLSVALIDPDKGVQADICFK